MNILHIIPSLAKGGAERLTLDICTALKQQPGVNVKLAVLHPENAYASEYADITPEHLPVTVQFSLSGKNRIENAALKQLLETFQPDIIHSHLFEAEIATRTILREGTAYFSHVHDNILQLRPLTAGGIFNRRNITDRYEKYWLEDKYRACHNRFIAISADTRNYMQACLPGSLKQQVVLLPNAIRYHRFYEAQTRTLRTPLRLLNCGSFTPKKNQTLLVDIMKQLRASLPDATITLAGDGALRTEVQQRAMHEGVQQAMLFPGNVHDMPAAYRNHDLYIHTALQEPFGLVLLEAMAAGLPVIALDGGGNRDIVQNGKNGYLILEADPLPFAEKINYLHTHPEVYATMSEYARNFAAAYDISPYTERLMNLYRETLVSVRK